MFSDVLLKGFSTTRKAQSSLLTSIWPQAVTNIVQYGKHIGTNMSFFVRYIRIGVKRDVLRFISRIYQSPTTGDLVNVQFHCFHFKKCDEIKTSRRTAASFDGLKISLN